MIRAASVLAIMVLCGVILVRYSKRHNPGAKSTSSVEMLSSLRLTGRDIFFVVRCGPDVVAFTSGASGVCLIGRWSYEEWLAGSESD